MDTLDGAGIRAAYGLHTSVGAGGAGAIFAHEFSALPSFHEVGNKIAFHPLTGEKQLQDHITKTSTASTVAPVHARRFRIDTF
jgi:hypothetical protein